MSPDWVHKAVDTELDEGEEIAETTEFESGLRGLAVAATEKRGFVVKKGVFGSPTVYPFDLPESGSPGVPETREPATEPEAPEPSAQPEQGTDARDPAAPHELTWLSGLGPSRQETLAELGVETFGELAAADVDELADALGAGVDRIQAWKDAVDLTGIRGIGPARAQRLREAGVQTVRDLVEMSPEELADELGVGEDTIVDWQKQAVGLPETGADLLEVDGIGAARARELIRMGYPDRASLRRADPDELSETFNLSEDAVEALLQAAED